MPADKGGCCSERGMGDYLLKERARVCVDSGTTLEGKDAEESER